MNNCSFLGRICADPEMRYTSTNKGICTFTLAVKREFSKDKTDFLRCQAWEKTGELINTHFKKGDLILIKGNLQIDTVEKDGTKTSYANIVVEKIYFVGGNKKSDDNTKPTSSSENNLPNFDIGDGALPF